MPIDVSGADLRTWAPVVSAIAAALAATASWRSVRQARRAWERSLLPQIEFGGYANPEQGEIIVTLTNVGSGTGSNVWVRAIVGDYTFHGLVDDNQRHFLRPGEGYRLVAHTDTPLPVPPPLLTMAVACDDVNGDRRFFGGRQTFVMPAPTARWRRWWLRFVRRVPLGDPMARDDWGARRAGLPQRDLTALTKLAADREFLAAH